jgi:hypothetical protein
VALSRNDIQVTVLISCEPIFARMAHLFLKPVQETQMKISEIAALKGDSKGKRESASARL